MALYVYKIADGALYSWSPEDDGQVADDATLAAKGLAKVVGLPPLDDTHVWDAATTTVVEIAPPVPVKNIATQEWILRFTSDEYQAIKQSTNADVGHFWFSIQCSTILNLNDQAIIDGVNLLVTNGLLDSLRIPEILV
jgi:hypothetical protein